jgi:hypothetical protein
MADLLNPSAAPVQPMSQAIEERPYRDTRSQAKKRSLPERPKPAAETDPEAGLAEDDLPKHVLDVDA